MSVDFVAGAFIFGKLSDLIICNGFDERFFVYFEEVDQKYMLDACQTWRDIGAFYMPEEVAIELVQLLNSGEYKL